MTEENKASKGARILAIMAGVFAVLVFATGLYLELGQTYWSSLIREHFAAIIGLPMAAIGAFVVFVFLKQGSDKPIEFEAAGFKFKDAAGLVVLWLMCFLGIAIAIKLLW
ncbi:MAG: hypothetical protein ACI8P9_004109 [Parasphingorhabdus sp.]|jgi:hypothetical protein